MTQLFDDLPATEAQPSTYRRQMKHCLAQFAERGLTLKEISGPKIMNKSIRTLQKHCRKYRIAFPDYIPLSMREKDGKDKASDTKAD